MTALVISAPKSRKVWPKMRQNARTLTFQLLGSQAEVNVSFTFNLLRLFSWFHLCYVQVVHCCEFDDERVVTGGGDKLVKIWSVQHGDCLCTLQGCSVVQE